MYGKKPSDTGINLKIISVSDPDTLIYDSPGSGSSRRVLNPITTLFEIYKFEKEEQEMCNSTFTVTEKPGSRSGTEVKY